METELDHSLTVDELKAINDKIAALLDDPHPGLFSWRRALESVAGRLSAWYEAGAAVRSSP